MKKRILIIVFFLLIMALLPFFAIKCNTIEINHGVTDKENKNMNENEESVLCGFIAGVYKENYCDETLKALAILINTSYSVEPNKFDINNNDIYIPKEDANDYLKENYYKIENAVSSSKELLLYNGVPKFIPYSTTSNGTTCKNNDYDYLCSIASPWDCYSDNYDKESVCIGVSIDGIDYLCKNGASAEEALLWYLPKFEISEN